MGRMATLGDIIAANVRGDRAKRRWSQDELGRRLGMGRSTVGDLESGRRKVTADDLGPLCVVFGVDLAVLARGANPDELRALGLRNAQ